MKITIFFLITIAIIYLNTTIVLITKLPHASIKGFVSVSDIILFATLLALIWYAWETKKIREIEQEPILLPFIRNSKNFSKEKQISQKEYITKFERDEIISNNLNPNINKYIFRIRNVGKGAAFNVKIKSDIFKVEKFQTNFLAPTDDEQSAKLVGIQKNIFNPSELKNVEFELYCESINHKQYIFKYKFIDFEKKEIAYIK